MIYLTSFFGPGEGPRISIVRWAPKGFTGDRETLAWLGARDRFGHPLRHLEPGVFMRRYYEYLETQVEKLLAWLESLDDSDKCLCCWCTPERQPCHPTLYCHRILVGYVIEEARPDLPLAYVGGAENPVWVREAS